MNGKLSFFLFFLFAGNSVFAQYTLNGNASRNNCHCYTLTNDEFAQSGSVWNNNKIDITQSFDFNFDVYLGCADSDGADGIAFVLQPISTSVGTQGSGLGYSGVTPAVGVTIDTWQNGSPTTDGPDGDPYFDHIAIQLNGDLNHKDSVAPLPVNNIAGPVTALAGNDNIEDCKWHSLRIRWDAPTKTLSAYVDGAFRISAVKDFTKDVFGGNPLVFWGFTGSTGGAKNLQQMCTSLKPLFRFLPGQKRCVGEKITFFDSVISFAPVKKFTWDFGDGSALDSVNLNPVHTYAAAGNYTIVQTVLGAEGCTEVNTQTVVIGSIPLADFTFNNACVLDSAVNFVNTSSAAFGTINNWFWDLDSGDTSTAQSPSKTYGAPGYKKVRLTVSSLEGCVSDTIEHIVQVYEKPVADFSFTDDQCLNIPVVFHGTATVNDGTISDWQWMADSAGSQPLHTQNPSYTYGSPGLYTVSLVAKSNHGCVSNTVVKALNVLASPVAGFEYTRACLSAPVYFTDLSSTPASNAISSWRWSFGNGAISADKKPVTIFNETGQVDAQLVVKSINGCISDTAKRTINIESKPQAIFGYGLPVCEKSPILFSDLSTISYGTVTGWSWIFDNGDSSVDQNATTTFSSGSHQVKLVVQNSNGCAGDTTAVTVIVVPRPVVDFTVTAACKNAAATFTGIAKPGDPVAQWQWNFDDGSISISKDTQHIYSNGGSFPVKLFGVSEAGCYSDTVQKNVTIYSTNAFAGNDTIAATNQPVQLAGSGGISYQWSPSTGLSNPNIANPIAINSSDRTYILKAFTPIGCESIDTILIKIYDGPEIYVPKAFTPNGDGLNELLKALAVGVKQFKNFTVYNRLGQVVFFTNVMEKGWDGYFNGKAQNAGVYIWTATAMGLAGNEIFRKGTVVLIR